MISPLNLLAIAAAVSAIVAFIIVYKVSENEWDKLPYYLFGWPLLFVIFMFIPATLVQLLSEPRYDYAIVLSVGGCDRYASCGVTTDKGVMWAKYPSVGERISYNRELIWKY